MIFNTKTIAVNLAVIFFFMTGLIGWLSGHTPFTCCKRSLIAAALIYISCSIASKAVNFILFNALISNEMQKQKEQHDDQE